MQYECHLLQRRCGIRSHFRLDHLDLKVFEESTHLWQTYKNRGDYCHGADRKCFEEFCLELPISIIKTVSVAQLDQLS